MKRAFYSGVISLLLLVVVWGALSMYPRWLTHYMTLHQQLYLRLFLGFLFSLLFFHKEIRWTVLRKLNTSEWALLVARALLYYLIGAVLYNRSLLLTTIGNASFITALPFTALLGFVFFGERLSNAKLFWIVTSFTGVLFLFADNIKNGLALGSGEVLALFSAIALSGALISRRLQSKKLNDKEVATIMLGVASIAIFVQSLLMGESAATIQLSVASVAGLISGGLLLVGMSYCMNYGFSVVPPALANNILTLDAPFSALVGFLLYSEIPTALELVGSVVILVSIVGIQRAEEKEATNASSV